MFDSLIFRCELLNYLPWYPHILANPTGLKTHSNPAGLLSNTYDLLLLYDYIYIIIIIILLLLLLLFLLLYV